MTDQLNPYQSPSSRVDEQQQQKDVPAERWRRFVNLVVDYVGFFLMSAVVGIAVGFIGGHAGLEQIQQIPSFVLGTALLLVYYIPQEIIFGRTLGKLVTGTKVIDENGGKPSAMQIVGRTFSRFIPFEGFSFFTEGARGWHDSLPRTRVVKCR